MIEQIITWVITNAVGVLAASFSGYVAYKQYKITRDKPIHCGLCKLDFKCVGNRKEFDSYQVVKRGERQPANHLIYIWQCPECKVEAEVEIN